ncbi:MAG: VOC family protein [Thaumarchaeota archaeon]|nr:VOC family protein [Nitrososphaerota archaeon]
MKIDHVSVAGTNLKKLEEAFSHSEMKTEYGGPHSSGLTEMSLLGFDDGSYIELISTIKQGSDSGVWKRQIEGVGGPCAWAIEVEDIAREVAKAKELGIPGTGPADYSRKRPDGVSVEWELGFIGEQEPGSVLPFLIKDKTPRAFRVKPSPSVSGGPLKGIGTVVIAVESLEDPVRLFRRLYGWSEPEVSRDLWDGVLLASFSGTPVVLAVPAGTGWLAQRLEKFGPSPCAFLIDTADLAGAADQRPLQPRQDWFEGSLRWVTPLKENGMMIGLVGR